MVYCIGAKFARVGWNLWRNGLVATRVVTACIVVFVGTALANAGSITIYDTNVDPWTLSWTAPNVTLSDTTVGQDENNPIRTTDITETKSFPNLTPIVLLLAQQAASASAGGDNGNPGASAGLNFVLHATVTNNDGANRNWMGFTLSINDLTPIDENLGTISHPANPHFHYTGGVNPYSSNPLKWVSGDNGGDFFRLGNGHVNVGDDLTFDARVHNIVIQNTLRSFQIIQTPLPSPEPSAMVLLVLGVAFVSFRRVFWRGK